MKVGVQTVLLDQRKDVTPFEAEEDREALIELLVVSVEFRKSL